MKRFFLLATVVLVLSVTFHLHSRKEHMGDLLLENVEALAAYEMSHSACVGNGSVDCPLDYVKVKYVMSGYSLETFN